MPKDLDLPASPWELGIQSNDPRSRELMISGVDSLLVGARHTIE